MHLVPVRPSFPRAFSRVRNPLASRHPSTDNENRSQKAHAESAAMTPALANPLADLNPGQEARIVAIHGAEALHQRLAAMGFRIGKPVQMMRRAAFNGPLHVRIGSTDVIIRNTDARCVELAAA